MDVKTGLSNRGYGLLKTEHDIKSIKKALTVTPLAHPEFPNPKAFSMYEETPKYLLVPRAYGIKHYGKPLVNSLKKFPTDNLVFEGVLRESQIDPYEKSKEHLNKNKTGILSLSTGSGKTYLALSLMCHLKQKTAVLVHKNNLLTQWKDEITKWIPKAKVNVVQGKKKDFDESADIHLIMIQTLLNIQTPPAIFGMLIIDEVHHIAAETFSKVLFKVNSRYILGLSATPKRADGLTHVLDWHLGGVFYSSKTREQQKMEVRVYQFADYSIPFNVKRYSESITALCNSKARNEYLMGAILDVLNEDEYNKRKVLILTDRVHHVKYIYTSLCQSQKMKSCGILTGDTKLKDHEEAMSNDIIVSTYGMFSEGISLPKLNTIVFATPKKDITQSVGRILRKVHSDVHAMVIDISDVTLRGQERLRVSTYYKEVGAKNVILKYYNKDRELTRTLGTTVEEDVRKEQEMMKLATTWSLI